MKRIKDNIYYKKLYRWFKIRKKKRDFNRGAYFRRSLFCLPPIRYWLSKITIRCSDSPRSSPRRCTRSMGQRYHQAIKKHRQRLLRSQSFKGETQWDHSVERSPHSSYYKDSRKTVLPNKNQLQWVSWPLQPRCPQSKTLFYVFKKKALTGNLPFIGMTLMSALSDTKLSIIVNLIISNTSFPTISMRSSKQRVTVDYPIRFIKNESIQIFHKFQLEDNKLNRSNDQENNNIDQKKKSKNPWWPGFNWDDEWDPDWDPNEGGMHGRFSSSMAWDISHWGDSWNNNGEHKNVEEIYTISNHWKLSSELENFLKFNIEQIPYDDSKKYLKIVFKIYQDLHVGSNNPPKTLEDLAEKNMLDWPWSSEALGNLGNYLSNLQTQNSHVDSHNPLAGRNWRQSTRFSPYKRNPRDLRRVRSDGPPQLNQLLQTVNLFASDNRNLRGFGRINSDIGYGSRNVSDINRVKVHPQTW